MLRRAVAAVAAVSLALGVAPAVAADDAATGADARVAAAVAQVDALAEDLLARSGTPGMAVGIVYQGRLVKATGYGVRDVRTGAPVTPETVFQLASVSKSVGASVVAAAVGRGIVTWNDPVVRHLPWFRLSDPYVTRTATIGDMYAMRSGLPGQAGDILELVGYDRREVLERLRTLPLDPFRISYNYTNFGLTTGAEAVAAAAGKPWDVLSEELIYRPLVMTDTSSRHADFVRRSNRAALHVPEAGRFVARYSRQPDAQSPAGGVSSTVVDMATWLTMELSGGWYGGRQIVPSLALAKAQSAQVRRTPPGDPAALPQFYGYGMNVQVGADGMVQLGHSGAFSAGAGTTYAMVPALDLGIVVLANALTGAPEALAQSFVELASTGKVSRDWWAVVAPIFAAFYATDAGEPPADAAESRPLAEYAGTYANGFWGRVPVIRGATGLALVLGPDRVRVPLRHWDGDTFRGVLAHGDVPTPFLVRFTGGRTITGLVLELGDSQDGTLARIGG
jgi:CubicO group peptidase (beta-lactamase class C family)